MTEVDVYRETSDSYLANARELLSRGEDRKAGELLWGSAAQAVKAVAATKDEIFERARELMRFAKRLALEVENERIWLLFKDIHTLHDNFYDEELDPGDVADYLPKVEELRAILARFIPVTSTSNAVLGN